MRVPIPTAYTKSELRMHRIISDLKVPFFSQEPILTEGKGYVADFLIMRAIVVEVDGESHEHGKQPMKDEHRDEAMKKLNLKVLRFTDDETWDSEMCAAKIRVEIERLPLEVRVAARLPAGAYRYPA